MTAAQSGRYKKNPRPENRRDAAPEIVTRDNRKPMRGKSRGLAGARTALHAW